MKNSSNRFHLLVANKLKAVNFLALKIHVRDKEFMPICNGHPAGVMRVEQ